DDSTDLALSIDDVNETPVLSFSGNGVDENTDTTGGYVVGLLSASDPDLSDLATFSVIGGADQDSFSIRSGNELVLNDGLLDFENQATYEVTLRVTDAGNLQQSQTVTITVNDLNEPIFFSNIDETITFSAPAVSNSAPVVIESNTFSVDTVNTTIVASGEPSLAPDPLPGRSAPVEILAEEETTTDELLTVEEDIFSDGESDSRFIDAALNRPNNNPNTGAEQSGKTVNLKQLVTAVTNLNPATKLLAEATTSLQDAFDFTALDSFTILDNGSFHNDLDDFRNELEAETRRGQTIVGSAVAASTGISIGYVVWLVRGGVLLSSVLSSLPAWRLIDPLPVLATVLGNSQDEEDDETLASMLEPEDPENNEDGTSED
ncbi:MAG: cadherin repeat domain-containing protein, partial [Pseudomonadales bacterium]